jgi:GT2 family glycosyltransferase/glycosyltransferase involved in cell wall biosynthesis
MPAPETNQSPSFEIEQRRQLEETIIQKNTAIAEITALLQAQCAEITALVKAGKLREAQIAEQMRQIAQHDEQVENVRLVNQEQTKHKATLQSKIEALERIVRAREEGIAYLRGEVAEKMRRIDRMEKEISRAEKQNTKLVTQIEKVSLKYEKKIRQMESTKTWKTGKVLRKFEGLLYPIQHPKGVLRALGLAKPKAQPNAGEASREITTLEQTTQPENRNSRAQESAPTSPEETKYERHRSIKILPELPADVAQDILNRTPPEILPRGADVISFSIVDWEFRFQRPQQIMTEFAAQGHRVFYISVSRFHPMDTRPRFTAKELRTNIYEVSLAVERAPQVYGEVIGGDNQDALMASLAELRRAFHIEDAVAYVTVPSWARLAVATRHRWGWHVLYDCMDEWEDFDVMHPVIIDAERKLVDDCDSLVVTAQKLQTKWQKQGRTGLLARNGVDYAFYIQNYRPNTLLDGETHPIIGYFGGIADWFDEKLMAHVARARPDCTFVLIGGVFKVDVSELESLPNVKLLGQQPYETMPLYLYHFDVCIIPFKINAITEATDPVKFYEYLSWGKPVVSTLLPELEQYREHLYLAQSPDDFVVQIEAALNESDPLLIERRRGLAQQHTWKERVTSIKKGIANASSRASIIIVTYNNLALTKLCLESVLLNTSYANYEIILVDNHSQDGTPAFLNYLAQSHPHIRLILNGVNRGFAAANNQGLAAATGDRFILLNNDTIVPPGWLQRLLRHLQDPSVGLVGPMTNFVGNEARLECNYQSIAEMENFAKEHTQLRDGEAADITMLAMFCLAMRRDTFEKLGPLDEQFGIGMFEDDDYAMRTRKAGLRVICAADVFVHHFGQAAFGKLIQTGDYDPLFDRNRQLFEAKWGIEWKAHKHGQLNFTSSF